MKVTAHFEAIYKVILQYIKAAKKEIKVATAWFTDKELFEALCQRAKFGVKVTVILINDDINCGQKKLNFDKLEDFNGSIKFIEQHKFNKMHNKFCIIDENIVITGSYNWTNQARNNHENITVIEDDTQITQDYSAIFSKILNPNNFSDNAIHSISTEMLQRRLEMIKNLILFDEVEDIALQLQKINAAISSYKLQHIKDSLEQHKYQQALEEITTYLKNFTALIIPDEHEMYELRFELKILEIQIESITTEIADIERCIVLFNNKQYEILGDLTSEILRLKAIVLENDSKAENITSTRKQQEAESAKNQYDKYSKKYQETLKNHINMLNEDDERELKKLFRKSCNLCHPDKVPHDQKSKATEIFINLKEAYDKNDLIKVKEIYDRLSNGDFSTTKSSLLNEVELLRSTVIDMRFKLEQILINLIELKSSSLNTLFLKIGYEEKNWNIFLESKRVNLEGELEMWKKKLEIYGNE